MRFEVGQKAGDYEFLEVVESGATGVTYRVRNTLADRQELLKVLPRDLQEDPERVERFLREAKIHARLHHPNIAAFYNATRVDDQLVMTSELVEGTSLEQRIAGGSLSLEQATEYFEQALAALSYAHQVGVVHRDITPRHLMITPDNGVKVTGFGLAKKPADPQLTQPGIVMGSMHYMSPEQVKGSSELDRRSDIYSLGVVLYEAVTGKKPFNAKSDFEVFMAHVNEEPPAPSSVRSGIPPEVDQIIRTAMAKQPADRFQTAEDFRGSLGKLHSVLARGAVEPCAAETPAPAPEYDAPRAAPHIETPGPLEEHQPSSSVMTEPAAEPVGPSAASTGPSAATVEEGSTAEEVSPSHQPAAPSPGLERWNEAATERAEPVGASTEPAAVSGTPGANYRRVTPESSGNEHRAGVAEPVAERLPDFGPSADSMPAQPFDDTWPDDEAAEPPREVPLLLRSTDEPPKSQEAHAAALSQRRQEPDQSWLGDQTFAGWTTKDVLAVGALTFVIVAAVFFAMLTFLNR